MEPIKAIHDSFWNKDDSFRNEAEMFRNIVCTGISRNIYDQNQVLILTIVQLIEFKLKLEYTKGPLSKVALKGQGPTTAVSL